MGDCQFLFFEGVKTLILNLQNFGKLSDFTTGSF